MCEGFVVVFFSIFSEILEAINLPLLSLYLLIKEVRSFLADSTCIDYPQYFPNYTYIFSPKFQEIWHLPTATVAIVSQIEERKESVFQDVEINPGKSLYINASLEIDRQPKLIQMIQGKSDAFAWDYSNMKGIQPDTCMHHIYTKDQIRPVRQP